MDTSRTRLNNQILSAHANNDNKALAMLYHQAADKAGHNSVDESCFFLTQAYVLSLEMGLDSAHILHEKLVQSGRET